MFLSVNTSSTSTTTYSPSCDNVFQLTSWYWFIDWSHPLVICSGVGHVFVLHKYSSILVEQNYLRFAALHSKLSDKCFVTCCDEYQFAGCTLICLLCSFLCVSTVYALSPVRYWSYCYVVAGLFMAYLYAKIQGKSEHLFLCITFFFCAMSLILEISMWMNLISKIWCKSLHCASFVLTIFVCLLNSLMQCLTGYCCNFSYSVAIFDSVQTYSYSSLKCTLF